VRERCIKKCGIRSRRFEGSSRIPGILFDLPEKEKQLRQLEALMAEPQFWSDQNRAQRISRELAALRSTLEEYRQLHRRYEDLVALTEMGEADQDPELLEELRQEAESLLRAANHLYIKVLLSGEYDQRNAIVTLHAGAGGTESQDWVAMLLRMYTRWAQARGYQVETLDSLEGEEAGLKSVTVLIKGEYAYGYLRAEKGVHRLVRISPFDSSGRRHTSFASVDVLPEIEQDDEVTINPEDLKVETFRASGAGGQHVNKTDSAVRITHLPTGIVVQCQNERSQHANRNTAMKILRSKLIQLKEEERRRQIEELRGPVKEIAWGNQIRSYVLQPYTLVKDHRTGVEIGDVRSVLDGEIDCFIHAFLREEALRNARGVKEAGRAGEV